MDPRTAPFAYVGDELDAAGLRLAGALTWAPQPGDELASFQAACTRAEVVFLAADVAERLPAAQREAALAGARPLVVLLPDGTTPKPFDPAERVRAQLGLDR
jgi:vacuolar-type H+-ATPase subunit F/Vma7